MLHSLSVRTTSRPLLFWFMLHFATTSSVLKAQFLNHQWHQNQPAGPCSWEPGAVHPPACLSAHWTHHSLLPTCLYIYSDHFAWTTHFLCLKWLQSFYSLVAIQCKLSCTPNLPSLPKLKGVLLLLTLIAFYLSCLSRLLCVCLTFPVTSKIILV